jgi:hypothetical protein
LERDVNVAQYTTLAFGELIYKISTSTKNLLTICRDKMPLLTGNRLLLDDNLKTILFINFNTWVIHPLSVTIALLFCINHYNMKMMITIVNF